MSDSEAVRKAKDAVILAKLQERDPIKFAHCDVGLSTISREDVSMCAHSLVVVFTNTSQMSNVMGMHGKKVPCEEMTDGMIDSLTKSKDEPSLSVKGLMEGLKKII